MHKILLYIISTLLAIAAFACGETHYDARLTAIDSIIDVSPDSALAELRALDYKSLSGSDNRAYYALLLTQARYKCYDSIHSTDTIEIAVARFTSNGDREKLTRSLIYKGATLEELQDLTNAMRQYKQAEESALPTDYYNLGYVNLRMAELYRNAYVGNQMDVDKYKKALTYFAKANDPHYKFVCLSNIVSQFRITDMDSAYKYSNEALSLAKECNDTLLICDVLESVARACILINKFDDGKSKALEALSYGEKYNNDIFYDLCYVYAEYNMIDSAEYFIKKVSRPNSEQEIIKYNWALCKLNAAKGLYKEAFNNIKIANNKSDSLQLYSKRINIIQTDRLFDQEMQLEKEIKNINRQIKLTYCLAISLLMILLLSYYIYKKNIQNRDLRQNIEQIYSELEQCKLNLSIKFKEQKNLNDMLQNHFGVVKELLESLFRNEKNLKKFISDFKDAFTIAKLSTNFWQDIHAYSDSVNNNIITRIKTQYPFLSEDEINFITLISLDFSYIEITVCMGYSNSRYISIKSYRIADKMGLNCSLPEFIHSQSKMQ